MSLLDLGMVILKPVKGILAYMAGIVEFSVKEMKDNLVIETMADLDKVRFKSIKDIVA